MRLIPSDPDVATIIRRIDDGTLDLQPSFQRGTVWPRPKQRLLIDSILRNWYVPPVHVVRTDDERQLVLDGQQRLRAISEFVRDEFPVDGNAEPPSDEIRSLSHRTYSDLPEVHRRRFDRFTLRVFEVVDYLPEEPWELFFRLNQQTTLTSAEKRNAFFGIARDQIKELTDYAMSAGMSQRRVGFSNARMAYEDVVARFLWTLEIGRLDVQASAGRVTDRYRGGGFSADTQALAADALGLFFGQPSLDSSEVRLNRAMVHSWLCFVARAITRQIPIARSLEYQIFEVETSRAQLRRMSYEDEDQFRGALEPRLLNLLNDRASSRVNDVASVLLRDACLWVLWGLRNGFRSLPELEQIATTAYGGPYELELQVLRTIDETDWPSLRQ